MIAKVIFFIFPLLLILLPLLLYRKHKPPYIFLWLRLTFDANGRKMAVNITQLMLIFFHITYFAVFPHDYGFLLSSVIVGFLFATKTCVKMILTIRRSKVLYLSLAVVSVMLLFVPHMFTTSFSIAALLECATFFPAAGLEKFYEEHAGEQDADRQFVKAYFN